MLLFFGVLLNLNTFGQTILNNQIMVSGKVYHIYPELILDKPDISSPFKIDTGQEYVIGATGDGQYAIIEVSVENGIPRRDKNGRMTFGKAQQLEVNSKDFPELSKTGLHSEALLKNINTITGISIDSINKIAKPGEHSMAGFIAEDEDLVSVLIGDNKMVNKMQLTHPELAYCLFHVWNFLLFEYEEGRMGGSYTGVIRSLIYNNKEVFISGNGSRGFQYSIFSDDILGNAEMYISRKPDSREMEFLRRNYSHLNSSEFDNMIKNLSSIHTGEMVPYYIMRYGFYEGHTEYRADPLSIAYIFGLKSIEELNKIFESQINEILSSHF